MTAIFEKIFRHLNSQNQTTAVCANNKSTSYSELFASFQTLQETLLKNTPKHSVILIDLPRGAELYSWVLASIYTERIPLFLNTELPKTIKTGIFRDFQPSLSIIGEYQNLHEPAKEYAPDICYIMQTSGSSGTPKSIAVTKNNFEAFLKNLDEKLSIPKQSKVSNYFEPSFDPFLADLFRVMTTGSTLYPIEKNQVYDLFKHIQDHQIEYISLVPSLAEINLQRASSDLKLPSLKQLIFTGEQLSTEVFQQMHELAPDCEFYNLYGPTECTIWSHMHKIDSQA